MSKTNPNATKRNSNTTVDKKPKVESTKKGGDNSTSNGRNKRATKDSKIANPHTAQNKGRNRPKLPVTDVSKRKIKEKKTPKQAVNVKTDKSFQAFNYLRSVWELHNIRPKSDDFIVDCISGNRTTDISLWPSLSIKRARTLACIGTKIKTSTTLISEDEAIRIFISTQDEPVLSDRYCLLVKNKIDEVFSGFPYEAIVAEIKNQDRKFMITNGSSNPPILAPMISGAKSNVDMIAAMAAGRDIFLSTFHIDSWTTAIADGKLICVPKNYKTPRVITVTSREFTDKQYIPSDALRDWITSWSRTSNHITQFDDQTVQHDFLKEGYATLDLSSASDRIYRSLLEKVWPDFMKYFGEFLPKTVSTAKGRIIPLTCIGTQGFPLTFTVMSIITGLIVAAVKQSNLPSGNYGDDVVVAEVDFNEAYCALEALGLKINKSKTHKSSNGFVESCGKDVMFTRNGARDVTPIHLRGTTDVDFVQFFHQLCKAEIIDVEDAKSILDKLHIEYYAFDYDYQLTEYHLPHGDIKNVPKPKWNYDKSQYICDVPAVKQEITSIKGLSVKDSKLVLELLEIEATLKSSSISELTIRGNDPVARPYRLMDLQDKRLYTLYQKLDVTGYIVPEIYYGELESEYNITFKAIMYYKFITSELRNYRFSTATVDFNEHKVVEYSIQDFIDTAYGIKANVMYPIYRYKPVKNTKTITHPKSNIILGVEVVKKPLA
jgi:hypothetical protein